MDDMIININDLDFDDDLDSEITFEPKSKNCIAIFNDSEDKYIGTGFIIDETGKFLSAGHNFKETKIKYKAYYQQNEYEIETIYFEYDEMGRDLFIGRLTGFKEEIDGTFCLESTNELELNHRLYVGGFNSVKYSGIPEPIQIKQHTLFKHDISTKLTILEERKDISSIRHKIDCRLQCENIKLLDLTNPEKYYGLSGGPVYDKNNIYGVCIADMFIPMEYIKKFL